MKKQFSLEEANRSLALVAPVVSDILTKISKAQSLHSEVKTEKARSDVNEVFLLEKLQLAEKYLNEVEYHMKELENIGAIFRDFTLGAVDFPCIHRGRLIYLCWMYGEKEIRTWHEPGESFKDRKTIDESFLTAVV